VYLPAVEREAQIAPTDLDSILRTHAIEPSHLRNADFDAFFQARTEALLRLVDVAMGKAAIRGEQTEPPEAFEAEPDEHEDDIALSDDVA
jgi:hypothetical protein